MTEKHDYTASIRRKGCEHTGITEGIAQEMYNTLGRRTLAIVELEHKRQINDDDTGRTVELVISTLEPSTSKDLDEHLREITRTLHQNRVLKSEGAQLQVDTLDDVEPTVEQVIAAGAQHVAETDDTLPDPALGTEDEPAVLELSRDDEGYIAALASMQHAHDADGRCVKNRFAPPCPDDAEPWEYEESEGQREPSTT